MRIPFSNRFEKVTAFTGLVAALVLVGMTFQALSAAATDEDCTDFGYVEGFKADNLTEKTYQWPAGYTVAVGKAGSDIQGLGHELVFKSETDPITHSSDKELSHIHFCFSPDTPAIEIVKSGAEFAHEGDEVTYTFTVTNIGDVDLTTVSVDDDILGHIGDVPNLAVDAEVELTRTMVVPAATSAVDNRATVCAGEALCDFDIHHLTVIHPAITIDKKVGGGDHKPVDDALVAHEGDELGYTVLITNTGDAPLEITALADSLSDAVPGSCSLDIGDMLEPGDDFTCIYAMDASSADAHNVVSVSGEDVLGGEKGTVGGEDETFVRVIDPEIQVVKVASPETVEPGQDVTYTYEVTNIGDTDLVDVEVSDDVLGDIGTVDSLAPGEGALLSTTTTIQADSPRTNVATACGFDELGLSACDTDDATITIVLPAGPEGRDGGEVLPTTGINLPLWIAAGIALIATGLVLIQSKGREEPV